MSDFCSTFAPNLNTIMEKRTYIQPKMEMTVLPKEVLMEDINPASGGAFPPGLPANPAPGRNVAGPKGVWL